MRLASLAMCGALLAGSLGLAGTASATPLAAGAHAAPGIDAAADGLVTKVWHRGHRHYGWGPVYRPYPVYRPRPRVVCRVAYQRVVTPYGRVITRPVQRCYRRW